jgi:DNA-binding response OmpR family regulator
MAKILVIEDERSIRQALNFELSDEGYDVHCAATYKEALVAIRTFDYDVVVSDIILDEGNGLQLMQLADNMQKDTHFIGITAFPDSEAATKFKSVTEDCLIEKPFLMPALKIKIGKLLKQNFSEKTATQTVYSG